MSKTLPLLPVLVAAGIVLLAAIVAFYPYRSLLLAAGTDRSAYAPGEPVNISVILRAGGNTPITLQFGSSCKIAFVVDNEGGDTIYNDLQHGACLQGFFGLTLQPGENFTVNFTWTQVNDSGSLVPAHHTYEIRPVLRASPSFQVTTTVARIFVG